MQRIVAEGWEIALVLEDDVDWDIRLKGQMKDVSRGMRLLSAQERRRSSRFDSRGNHEVYLTWPHPENISHDDPYGDD